MSQFETSAGIDSLTGKLNSKERIVMRQKKYRLPSGRIIKLGPKEAYVKERRVCREGSRIVHNENHPRYSELYDRWIAQATGTSDPVTGKRCIARFINFVCAVLLREKQSG